MFYNFIELIMELKEEIMVLLMMIMMRIISEEEKKRRNDWIFFLDLQRSVETLEMQ